MEDMIIRIHPRAMAKFETVQMFDGIRDMPAHATLKRDTLAHATLKMTEHPEDCTSQTACDSFPFSTNCLLDNLSLQQRV